MESSVLAGGDVHDADLQQYFGAQRFIGCGFQGRFQHGYSRGVLSANTIYVALGQLQLHALVRRQSHTR